jgi:acyl-CoA thioester hydrolase
MRHRTTVKVRFYELDPYDHVNHSIYIQYFEAARAEWLTEIGYPLSRMKEDGIQIVVTDLNTRYLGSAGPNDELVVESELVELRRVSMTFEQRISRGDEVLVTQTISAAAVTPAGRPTRIPDALGKALQAPS